MWNYNFNDFLMKFDLEPTKVDPCVYISKGKPHLIVKLFMDDGLACCFSPKKLEALIAYTESHLAMLLNPLSTYINVGLHIHWNEDDGQIFIHHGVYLHCMLACFALNYYTPLSTHVDPNVKLNTTSKPFNPPFVY